MWCTSMHEGPHVDSCILLNSNWTACHSETHLSVRHAVAEGIGANDVRKPRVFEVALAGGRFGPSDRLKVLPAAQLVL